MLWVYGVISNHILPGHAHCPIHCPTQSHAHTFLITLYLQSIPTKLLICRSNCSHFSSWIQVSIIALNRFPGRRMIVCARVSQKRRKSSPKIHTCANDFCFSTPYYCTANPLTNCSYIACAEVHSSVQHLHDHSFCKSATPTEILGTHGNDKWKTTCGHGFGWGNGCGC